MHAVVAGKPYAPMVDSLVRRFGPTGTVVGDRGSVRMVWTWFATDQTRDLRRGDGHPRSG